MDTKCPLCKLPLLEREGKNGPFLGCTGFPKCKYTKSLKPKSRNRPPNEDESKVCNEMLVLALQFLHSCGGAESARRWIQVADLAMEALPASVGKEDSEPTTDDAISDLAPEAGPEDQSPAF